MPPPHRQGLSPSPTRHRRRSSTSLDGDSYGVAAPGGGMTGLAAGIADSRARNSGMHALRDIDNLYGGRMMSPSPEPEEQPYGMPPANYPPVAPAPYRPTHQQTDSHSSVAPLVARGASPVRYLPSPPRVSRRSVPAGVAVARSVSPMPRGYAYQGDGYDEYVDANDIIDDGDDGLEEQPRAKHSPFPSTAAGAGAGAAVSGGPGVLRAFDSRDPSGKYGAVPRGGAGGDPEKSEWLAKQSSGSKRMRWIIGGIIGALILAAIVGGVVGGVLARKRSSSSSSSGGSTSSTGDSKDLYDIDSHQVQALLKNDALHKVFPGIDYTPLDAQYPACLTAPPDQNNVTLDMAMLSQLTPAVRLYGTDCNQTEMVLTAIDKLGYNATLKVWLGVWLGTNATTNTRQLQQMYDILDTYPSTHFAGVIVGNEVLFRKDLTETELGDQLQNVRKNLTARSIDLPVATSDLGDDWTTGLAADTDIVMSNVHPFFAGVTPDVAPGWAWNFWQTHDVVLTGTSSSSSYPKNIISEVGWPSSGGNDCGTDSGCANTTAGSVASIENMNSFMDGWVCQSLTNGTTYFWFEAFDEPWKIIYNTETDKWESQWGLMDSNRNVKDGLKIPDCSGRTVDKPY
ncbi:hypothetical protein LTR36_006728 [Oleoguttula mirabilis]|uniref:glucan endo-1,3-beta-D-glucosidase n=1 Tax=Oleoguttula mirabilis TaxID=1507867 RepID=A0AAV9JBC6_9PEZI|nr:hypothetical protein LTR36_006728 [Oleoguttula mirabilis]